MPRAAGTGTRPARAAPIARPRSVLAAIDQVCLRHGADAPARRAGRPLGRRRHGGAAGAAPPCPLQRGRDALRRRARHRALVGQRAGGDARTPARGGVAAGRHGLPPLLVIQGGADAIVAPSNGRIAAQLWAAASGASAGAPRSVQRGRRHRVPRHRLQACRPRDRQPLGNRCAGPCVERRRGRAALQRCTRPRRVAPRLGALPHDRCARHLSSRCTAATC